MAPPTPRPVAAGQAPDIAQTRAALRPELAERVDAALPGARAAVLSRILGALDREPLPGVMSRHSGSAERVSLADGRTVEFPAAAGRPFADAQPGLTACVRGTDPSFSPSGRGLAAHAGESAGGSGLAYPGREFGRAEIDDPGTLILQLWPDTPPAASFAAEVDNSVANLALARATQPTTRHGVLAAAAGDPDGLGRLEQLVTDGHPLHPCCRTRGGMSTADVLLYAPEHRPVIRLRRLRVPPDRWYGDAPPVLYAHPWQAERLRDRYRWLSDDGETAPVRPLMSLRTVAPLDGGDHYKTAVDVQMTSAVRTVSPAAVHNGPRLSALLATLTADLPLTVLRETAAGAVIVDGTPQRHLAHLRRQAPRAGPGETVLPLGALALPGLLREATGSDPYRWFTELAPILWTPLVTVLGRGVALEAHGQNTLVVLRAGRPHRIVYRDLGGVRVSARRLRAAGVEPPDLRGDLPSDDPTVLRAKLAAAALGTVAAELITALQRQGADPAPLWATVAAAIRVAGTPDVPHLLGDPLPIKAMTAMRLAPNPLDDIWTCTDNPLAATA